MASRSVFFRRRTRAVLEQQVGREHSTRLRNINVLGERNLAISVGDAGDHCLTKSSRGRRLWETPPTRSRESAAAQMARRHAKAESSPALVSSGGLWRMDGRVLAKDMVSTAAVNTVPRRGGSPSLGCQVNWARTNVSCERT